ncbi:MAG: Rrf2 family transcriptional regulator [Desulfosarcinaceae bacterium]|nr:Rrf2 family transcriptional regulator [Desulfosarcinaceae bacterium]
MLLPPKKEQYAVRAIYELAKRSTCGPTKISDIADAQSIPVRFLEVILGQLKKSGLVASKRGFYGGYYLLKPPEDVSVGEVLRFLQRRVHKGLRDAERTAEESDGAATAAAKGAALEGHAAKGVPAGEGGEDNPALEQLWRKVKAAAYGIYDDTTMKDLLDVNTAMEE